MNATTNTTQVFFFTKSITTPTLRSVVSFEKLRTPETFDKRIFLDFYIVFLDI